MKIGTSNICKSLLGLLLLLTAFTFQPLFAEGTLKPEEIEKISAEAQKTLNGFTWNLEVSPTAGKKEDRKIVKDTVIFKDGKMSSDGLAKKGYGTSNYTLTVGDDGVPVFETMQRDTDNGVAFWRGEIVEGKIRGVISVQKAKEAATTFGFRGEKAGEAAEIPAERVEPQPEPVAETVAPAEAAPAADAAATDANKTETAVTEVAAEKADEKTVTEAAPAAPVAPEAVAAPADKVEDLTKVEPKKEEAPKKESKLPWWMSKKK